MRVRTLAAAAAAAVVAVPFGAVAAQASDTDDEVALVTLVHGLEAVGTVDVFVTPAGEDVIGDDLLIDDFNFKDVEGLFEIAPGDYEVRVYTGDTATVGDDDSVTFDPATPPALGPVPVPVPGPVDVTIVAGLNAAGEPSLLPFLDDFSEPAEGAGRLTVRHAAAAPEVGVFADGGLVDTIANGEEVSEDLPAAAYDIEVKAGEDVIPELTPGEVPLEAGQSIVAYAVGSLEGENLELIVDSFSLVEDDDHDNGDDNGSETTAPAIPTAVPAGDGTAGWTGPLAVPALLALAVAGLLALAVTFTVRRSATGRH